MTAFSAPALARPAAASARPALARTAAASSPTASAAGSTAATAATTVTPNALAATPPMGWNDWYSFGCNVSASPIEQTAKAMVTSGIKAAGYQCVNIDDRRLDSQSAADGSLQADPAKFPDGIKAVADYVYSHGLKLGIYEDVGIMTCAGDPGSYGHYQQDAQTLASWGMASQDGITFIQVAAGSWAEDGTLKQVTFPAVQARDVELVSVQGGNGATSRRRRST